MIKIAGHWELSWNAPIKEVELWNFPLRDFDIKHWYMWPISGIVNSEEQQKVHLMERKNFKDILEENKDIIKVYVEPNNPKFPHDGDDLREFKHPKDVLYIFGSAHFNPIIGNKKEEDLSVIIPTIRNNGVLWPHQCLVTILYDRLVKGWQ